MSNFTRDEILDAIREANSKLGHVPSKSEFKRISGIAEYHVRKYFDGWNHAIEQAGFESYKANIRIDSDSLLEAWGRYVRRTRGIPTRDQYRRDGKYSVATFEKKIGPWSKIPSEFKQFADGKSEWSDVLTLLPIDHGAYGSSNSPGELKTDSNSFIEGISKHNNPKLKNRPIYGRKINFRGLLHGPVNEAGVIFLFGMVARELGYMVEAIQAEYPDCEAKRLVGRDKWQSVRIEFEYDSRNFRDHGHDESQCDIIVCWHHNWPECPSKLEVVELSSLIGTLAASEDN